MHTHSYTHIHTRIHTRIHTHAHTHTHTHTSGGVIYIFPKFCPDSCYQGTCAERDRLPSAKRKWTIHSSGSKFAHGRHSTFREAEVECQKGREPSAKRKLTSHSSGKAFALSRCSVGCVGVSGRGAARTPS